VLSGRRGRLVVGVALALSVMPVQSVAAATGPYSLPSWENVGRSRSYGCVTGTASAWQGTNADGTSYNCAHFHNGIDFSLSYDPVVATRSGTVINRLKSTRTIRGPRVLPALPPRTSS
jgi:murein DD-endopeptidase MepM/ murein hydrolase activator NlpD